MFRPSVSILSEESIRDDELDGFTFQNPTAQYVRAGVIRLLPQTGALIPEDLAWPKVTWTHFDELKSFPGDIASRWTTDFNNQPITSPQTFEFEPASGFLDIDTAAGEYQWLYRTPGVNNAQGWTLQFRMQVIDAPTGYERDVGHSLLIDDGTHREQIVFTQTGLRFLHNPALDIYADLSSKPREIRIGVLQDDIYVLLDDGRVLQGVDQFTGNSVSPSFAFGQPTGAVDQFRSMWDYIHWTTAAMVVDQQPLLTPSYDTGPVSAWTPSYAPSAKVQRFVAARIFAEGGLGHGTTTIQSQYKSSIATEWTDGPNAGLVQLGWTELLLDNIPTAGDGSDEVRFEVIQTSDGIGEPPRVARIQVETDFSQGSLRLMPPWGHVGGGNTVAVEMVREAARATFRPETGLQPFQTHNGSLGSTGAGPDLSAWLSSFREVAPYGWLGTPLSPVVAGVGPGLAEGEMGYLDGTLQTFPSQKVTAVSLGDGFSVPHTGPVSFLLEVTQGSVEVLHGSDTHIFSADDYFTARRVRIPFSGAGTLTLRAGSANSIWAFADPTGYSSTPASTALTGTSAETGAGFAADVTVTMQEIGDGALFGRLSGNSGFEIGLTDGGLPYVKAGDGTSLETLIGNVPVRVGVQHTIALNYRRFSDHTGLQVFLDGQLCGDKLVTLSTVAAVGGSATLGGSLCGYYRDPRVYATALDGEIYGYVNGYATPVFRSEGSLPTTATTRLILRLQSETGTIADDSGRAHHAYPSSNGRRTLYRDRYLRGQLATAFWGDAEILVKHSPDFLLTRPFSVFVQGAFTAPPATATLCQKWSNDTLTGFAIEITTEGRIRVRTKDGSTEVSVTSAYVITDGYFRGVTVVVSSTGITIHTDGMTETFAATINDLTAGNGPLKIGRGIYAYLRQFAFIASAVDQPTHLEWIDWTIPKWKPDEQVYVGDVLVDPTKVVHAHQTAKLVIMPAGDVGYTTFDVEFKGLALTSERPYKYTHGYHREIPAGRIDLSVATTKSPFRVLGQVPDGSVNLALIESPVMTVGRNVNTVDLSYRDLENLATYHGGEFMVTDPLTGPGYAHYTGQMDTEDVVLSNRSVMRRSQKEPRPLFYRYLIGRGRHYVYQPNAATVSDVEIIRNGLRILDEDGREVQDGDMAWDIQVAGTDIDGNALPAGVYAVTLFTNRAYLAERTVTVHYNSVDRLNSWSQLNGYFEIVNTQPIFGFEASPGNDQFHVTGREDGLFDLKVGSV